MLLIYYRNNSRLGLWEITEWAWDFFARKRTKLSLIDGASQAFVTKDDAKLRLGLIPCPYLECPLLWSRLYLLGPPLPPELLLLER